MAHCKHYETCGLEAFAGGEFCTLHLPNPNKNDTRFQNDLQDLQRRKQNDYQYIVFPQSYSGIRRLFSQNSVGVNLNFSNATFLGSANFNEFNFNDGVSFANATFTGDANFQNSAFGAQTDFSNATFKGGARFPHSMFHASVLFHDTV